MTKTVVIATNNAHKVSEISNALNYPGWEFKTLCDLGVVSDPVEDGDSFEANARIKALAAHEATGGLATLADDSGLEVDALGGAPGVYSSRYCGEDGNDEGNNAKLLREMADVADEDRGAQFACTLVFIDEDGSETVATGVVRGKIGYAEQGDAGFGYDPLFFPDEFDGTITFAEVSQDQKATISHRGRALRELANKITPSK